MIRPILVSVLLLASLPLVAATPPAGSVTLSTPSYSGTGCPAGSVASDVSPDNQAFTLLFDSFLVEGGTGDGAERAKSCVTDVNLSLPAGWSFQVLSVDTRGYASLASRQVKVDVRSRVSVGNNSGNAASGMLRLRGPYDDDFQIRAEVNGSAGRWTSCTSRMHRVRIDTEIKVKRESVVAADSLDGQVQALALAWKRCPDEFRDRAQRHVDQAARRLAVTWRDATVASEPTPLYRPDVDGVAYLEFKVTRRGEDAGFVVVATGDHDFPVPHWRATGRTPSEDRSRLYEYEPSAVRLETRHANPEARLAWLDRVRREARAEEGDDDWSIHSTPGPSPMYDQIPAGTGPNDSACLSGCGATAWAILFGWADIQAESDPAWSSAASIFDGVAPDAMDARVEDLQWKMRTAMGTWCTNGSGATSPWNMGHAQDVLTDRTSARIESRYNMFGSSERRLTDFVIQSIVERHTPAVIGTGWLEHYPVATAYAVGADGGRDVEWFYVNQGWGGTGDDWVAPSTWFAGTLLP